MATLDLNSVVNDLRFINAPRDTAVSILTCCLKSGVHYSITDNLGLRQFYEYSSLYSSFERFFSEYTGGAIDRVNQILIISVNAAIERNWPWAEQASIPAEREVLAAMTHIQMRNYTADTIHIVQDAYRAWQRQRRLSKPAHFEFVQLSFSHLADKEERAELNALPTSLQLSEEQVDHLIEVGGRLLRNSPKFQQFLARNRPEHQTDQ